MNKKNLIIIISAVLLSFLAIALIIMPNVNKSSVLTEQEEGYIEYEEVVTENPDGTKTIIKKPISGGAASDKSKEEVVVVADKVAEPEDAIETGAALYKPTFIYFITNDDKETADELIKKLKGEFGEKVVFELKNIDEEESLKDNFPVDGNTPALIMLNPVGDISNILFKTADYETLKSAIDTSFNVPESEEE